MLIQLNLIIEQIYKNNTIKNLLKEKIEVLIKENCKAGCTVTIREKQLGDDVMQIDYHIE